MRVDEVVEKVDAKVDVKLVYDIDCVDTVFGHVSMFGRVQAGRIGRRCFVYRMNYR